MKKKNKYHKPQIKTKKINTKLFRDGRIFDAFYSLIDPEDVYAYPCASSSCTCLSGNSFIATPDGFIPIKNLNKGDNVWTLNSQGNPCVRKIVKTVRVSAPKEHKIVYIVLADNRKITVSPGHPVNDHLAIRDLGIDDYLGGSQIKEFKYLKYKENYTYDILPSGDTGQYWANGILLASTLKVKKSQCIRDYQQFWNKAIFYKYLQDSYNLF